MWWQQRAWTHSLIANAKQRIDIRALGFGQEAQQLPAQQ
jgi:hypothetical protein